MRAVIPFSIPTTRFSRSAHRVPSGRIVHVGVYQDVPVLFFETEAGGLQTMTLEVFEDHEMFDPWPIIDGVVWGAEHIGTCITASGRSWHVYRFTDASAYVTVTDQDDPTNQGENR